MVVPGGVYSGAGRAHLPPGKADIKINGLLYPLLADRPNAKINIFEAPNQSGVAPTEYGYGAQNPQDAQTHEWGSLIRGIGLTTQETAKDAKVRYTIRGDTSTGVWGKGPKITHFSPPTRDSTNGINHQFEINGSLYYLNGRYCLRRDSDTVVSVANDFGSGNRARDVIVFYTNASGAVRTTAYVAMGGLSTDPFIWKFDGFTWTQHTTLRAEALGVVAGEIYLADDTNRLRKPNAITDDPWTAA